MTVNPDRRRRPLVVLESEPGGAPAKDEPERKAVEERSEAHRRWIGGDLDDPACRGID